MRERRRQSPTGVLNPTVVLLNPIVLHIEEQSNDGVVLAHTAG